MEIGKKIIQLKNLLSKLKEFSSDLSDENLNEFYALKSEISDLLDDNQQLRFNRIQFFSEIPDSNRFNTDDLPF